LILYIKENETWSLTRAAWINGPQGCDDCPRFERRQPELEQAELAGVLNLLTEVLLEDGAVPM